jgi:C4-dicarboxylate-specific signal transduction histidine kinase
VLDDRTDGDHAERIVESANTLATMGERARTIDRVLSGDVRERPVDLEACLGNAIRRVDQPDDVAIVATGVATGTAEVVTDRRVLLAVLESALENAAATAATRVEVTAERASDGWRLVIDPDGSGLPKAELNALAAGTETPLRHGRGLGLWQLKWGVEKISGRLSFDTDNGTTVRIGLPA